MSAGHLARRRSITSNGSARPPLRTATPIDPRTTDTEFEPCAATGALFLFAQGSSILCLHHDTLALDRRYERHSQKVTLLVVDNVSERDAGRLCFSYDAGGTAMVWDLLNGDEIVRFQNQMDSTFGCAAFMANGNIVLGEHGRCIGRRMCG